MRKKRVQVETMMSPVEAVKRRRAGRRIFSLKEARELRALREHPAVKGRPGWRGKCCGGA